MWKKFLFCLIIFEIVLCTGNNALSQSDSITLKVGDHAPALNIIKWVKGKPITSFKKGQVYIIEFTETYCVPCRKSIPLLSALAKKFAGKATIISVYAGQSDKDNLTDLTYINAINEYVKVWPHVMDFTVAIDVPIQTTKENWMDPAGQKGFPNAFILDQSGTIVWIGHPLDISEEMISKIINESFNVGVYNLRYLNQKKLINDCTGRIFEDKANGNFSSAFKAMDSLIEIQKDPILLQFLYSMKYEVLQDADDDKAELWIGWLLNQDLYEFDWFHLAINISGDTKPNYKMAMAVAERAYKEASTKILAGFALDLEATIYYRMRNIEKAVEAESAALNCSKSTGIPQDTIRFALRLKNYIAAIKPNKLKH